jgi:acyl dehydratase
VPDAQTRKVSYDQVEVGTEIEAREFPVQRWALVQYAGASGDFNPIHWNEKFAKMVGLPDVIAHGMFTMATAARLLTDWVGDPAAVVEYGVRFSAMVVVSDEGATLSVSGTVEEKLDDGKVAVGLTARSGDNKVLTQARAVVQLG